MKLSAALALLTLASSLSAQDLQPIAQPDLKSPLPAEWAVQKGKWDVQDGVMTAVETPEEKHAAVLWHKVPLQTGTVECEFLFDGAKIFILGCDSDRHIGRIAIAPKSLRLLDDSTEVKGKSPATKLAEVPLDLKSGQWYTMSYSWSGDKMRAKVGDVSIEGSAPTLAKKKARWWFAVGGAAIKIRNIKVTGIPDLAK